MLDVETRQYYPNLVTSDPQSYQIIGMLAGRTPGYPSGRMSLAEVQLAQQFVREGGTLILGPNLEGGEGANERYLFNRVLSGLDVEIRISNEKVEDPENFYAGPLWERPYYNTSDTFPGLSDLGESLPADRSVGLATGSKVQTLLASFETATPRGETAIVASSKAGDGHVIVASRFVLNALEIPLRISGEPLVHPEQLDTTKRFLEALAAYIVDLRVGDADLNIREDTKGAVGAVAAIPDFDLNRSQVLERVPDEVQVHEFDSVIETGPSIDLTLLPDLYRWVREEGVRACWGSTVDWSTSVKSEDEINRVVRALKDCGVNLFWGISNCQAVGGTGYSAEERSQVQRQWEWTAAALDGSSTRWFPTLDYRYFRGEGTSCFGAQGQKLHAPSPMDRGFWRENWEGSLLAIAEFSLQHPCVAGIALDLELYAHPPAYNYYMAYGFEDECWVVLERIEKEIGSDEMERARRVQLPDRFDWLRERGLLERYFGLLSGEVEEICRGIRDRVMEVNPELLWASYIFMTPTNWFDLGVYRGLSSPDRPVILMTFNVRSNRMLEYLRSERIYALHASVALLGMIQGDEYETVFRNSFKYGHGYWMNNVNALLDSDSVSVESPARQGLTSDEAISLIAEANRNVRLSWNGKGGETR